MSRNAKFGIIEIFTILQKILAQPYQQPRRLSLLYANRQCQFMMGYFV